MVRKSLPCKRLAESNRGTLCTAGAALLVLSAGGPAQGQLTVEDFPELEPTNFSYVSRERVEAFQNEALQNSIEPFKIFDNLYYVGIEWVASYLLVTEDGLILIDSLHEPYIESGVEHIRQLGFDPADIRYVLGTHGHFDHMGGHAYYQDRFGARVGLTAGDWKRAQADADRPFWGMEMAEVDLVVQDGDTLRLGEQTMRFYVTPGHTEGVLSMEFTVRDGGDEHRAVIFGGAGAQGDEFWKHQTVLGNIRRFQALAVQSPPVRVRLPTHPQTAELRQRILARGASDPHPLVDEPGAFMEYLEQAERNVERTLLEL